MSAGLLITAFAFGLRHGVDWDHIAAIADLSATAENRRRGFVLSFVYALGHGVVVFALGTIAILAGNALPAGVDAWMGRVVGVTLIALGAWILVELLRKGSDFRLQSRWMLIINGTFAGLRRVRAGRTGRSITLVHEHQHEHSHEHFEGSHDEASAHDHSHLHSVVPTPAAILIPAGRPSATRRVFGHRHRHRHDLVLPGEPTAAYGKATAAGIGILHGIGIESPTQIAIFVASTAAAGTAFGLTLLGMWVSGLIVANCGLAALAGAGLLQAERNFRIYATLAVVLGVASIVMGALYLSGLEVIPAIN